MKQINIKLLLNRTVYNMTDDLKYIKEYMHARGVQINWNIITTDITGYSITTTVNPFGNEQNVLTGAEALVKPYLSPTDDICALCIQGFKEFGVNCPSEREDKQFIPGTKTVFLSINADDSFYDQVPNFRIWFMHEITHALGTIAMQEGYPIVDTMDKMTLANGQTVYYFRNYEPENVNSNFTNMFEQFYSTGFLKYD